MQTISLLCTSTDDAFYFYFSFIKIYWMILKLYRGQEHQYENWYKFDCSPQITDIGVGRFRILGVGGARFRILGGARGGTNSQQAHDVVMTSMRRRIEVVTTSCANKVFNKSVPNNYISHLKI